MMTRINTEISSQINLGKKILTNGMTFFTCLDTIEQNQGPNKGRDKEQPLWTDIIRMRA